MRQTDCSLVRALPLFSGMSEKNFDGLLNAAFLQRFPQHVSLITEGDLPDFLHIVIEGSVELFSAHNGRETTIDIIRPVTTFILAAVIRDAVYLKSARTLAPAQVLMIPAQTVRDAFGNDAAFARAIVDELADRYRGVVRSLKSEKLRTSAERLANWILQTDAQQGGKNQI
ncbi:MAG: cyclic nucleotide-binding domain-containing protein, partial [Candidatus Binatia bacterium]